MYKRQAQSSSVTDTSDPAAASAFTSSTQDQLLGSRRPLIEPAHLVALPKGQCFALLEGGALWKVRMPLPLPDADDDLPADLRALTAAMRRHPFGPKTAEQSGEPDSPLQAAPEPPVTSTAEASAHE